MPILIWKNVGDPLFNGKEIEYFRVSWDEEKGELVRDETGPWWGIQHPADNQLVRLLKEPRAYGTVKLGAAVPRLDLGKPILGVIENGTEEEE